MIQAIHTTIKGRARYRIEELYRSPSLQKYLERSLDRQEGVIKVKANSVTGNLLVKFKPDKTADEIVSLIKQSIATYKQNKSESASATRKGKNITEGEEQPAEDWHLLELDSVLDKFSTSEDAGLDSESASQNLDRYGANALSESKSRSDWSIITAQFQSLPVALLGVAAGISVVTGGFADAVAIAGVVLTNSIIGYTTESQSEKIINSLQSDDNPSALVIRDGEQQEIDSTEIVTGDILLLQTNNYVAADARLIESNNLSIDESALTGESIAVTKEVATLTGDDIPLGDRTNMVYKETFVTEGKGKAIVVATGKFTEMGKIQGMVSEAEKSETPLQQQLDDVGSQLVLLCSGVCGLTFSLGLLRGYGFLPMLKTAISLAVASVPEGLPTIATTTLALGMRDMRQRNILIRGLNAVEALGSVQTICLDKTGTITQNKMVVAEVHTGVGVIKLEGDRNVGAIRESPLLQVVVLCSESEIIQENEVKGSATENALIYMAMGSGKADVVKEVADVVIEDDQLETMIDAVSRGRTIYNNIRKSVRFLLSTNLTEIMVTTVTTALGLGEPLNTMQLLWLNLVSDIFPGLALAMEPPEPEILNRPPRDPESPIIQRSDFERIALESGVISASALSAYAYGRLKYEQQPQASTILFMSLTLGQVLHTISCRSQTHSIFDKEKLPDNPYVDGAVVGSAALQLLPIFIPPLGNLLQLAPLDPLDWLVVASSAGLPLVVNETTKGKQVMSNKY